MKRALITLIIILAISFAAYKAAMNGYIRLNYPSFEKYPIHGIDISHHQIEIDWDSIEKEYLQFVFIKATEGTTHQDSLFSKNWEEAKRLNIPKSAYHFFTFCTSGKDQAQNYITTVPVDSLSLPPTIDLEFGGNCREENRLENLQEEICDFIKTIEAHYNKKVIIYSTREFYDMYIENNFPNNPIWIRDIISEPRLENSRPWLFWQYANRAKLKGITTFVDLNAFEGKKEDLEILINTFID